MIATQCSSCALPATVTSTHRTSEGTLRYLRCVCGRSFVALGGEVIGAAGESEFPHILGGVDGSPAPVTGRAS